jgi:hypothetical protein
MRDVLKETKKKQVTGKEMILTRSVNVDLLFRLGVTGN